MIRTNRPLQFGEWSGAGQRQSAVTSQCHGLQKLHAGRNVATVYPIDKVGKSVNLQICMDYRLIYILPTFRCSSGEIIKPYGEWLCNYCAMGEFVQLE